MIQTVPVEWQPITGCSYASPGCTNCKAMQLAPPDMRAEFLRDGLVTESKVGPVWTGAVRFSEARLTLPTETGPPTEFVVCPHSDLFHDNVATAWIDRVFDQMEKCNRHGFHVATKRAARMQAYVSERYRATQPSRHIFFGVSCERQVEVDERVPLLQRTPAAVRYLTLYPLLGPINLRHHFAEGGIRFVYAGHEVERPAETSWFRAISQQCQEARVPVLFSNELVGQNRPTSAKG
jgi:protein gp37